tara:strand:- start:2965 stop:3408 length:444 start_codon:yes stop_codon:yes gene_type:complete
MLITCSSCNSKYLINSADLKPNGRNVRCARCNFSWFLDLEDRNIEELQNAEFTPNENHQEFFSNNKNNDERNKLVTNLPSTVVKEKTSILNSVLIVMFSFLVIFLFWFIKNQNFNYLPLILFYLNEFYFNLKMIINDIAKIVHQVLN